MKSHVRSIRIVRFFAGVLGLVAALFALRYVVPDTVESKPEPMAVLTGCTPAQRAHARTALDVAQTLCIIANQFLPDTDVARVCGIGEDLFDPMRNILSSARQESGKAAARARAEMLGSCAPNGPDAGTPDASASGDSGGQR